MTSTDIDSILNSRAPQRTVVGQATAIEQSRAVAEVQAMVVVAQQCPRNMALAVQMMRESCNQNALASRAFFRYSRAGSQITGPSIHLARELARIWGNITYGISELRRDDDAGESEMLAQAWDVQTNTRNSSTFIVKHRRDTKNGQKELTELRDIYENNANHGARRVREAIYAVLPPWFVEEAKEVCIRANEKGDGKPFPQRVDDAISAYANRGIRVSQLEDKLGRKQDAWEPADIAQLELIWRSVNANETTFADEFNAPRVSVEDFAPASTAAESEESPAAPEPAAEEPATDTGSKPATRAQLSEIGKAFDAVSWTDKNDRLRAVTGIVGRTVSAAKDLTQDETKTVLDVLAECAKSADPPQALTDTLEAMKVTDDERADDAMQTELGDES